MIRRLIFAFFLLLVLFVVIGCGPEATPFPAEIPTDANGVSQSDTPVPIRYALAANTQGFVEDLALIQASAEVEQLTDAVNPDDLGSRYDLVVAFGDLPDGTHSPNMMHIALVKKPIGSSASSPILGNILAHSINPQAVVSALGISAVTAETRSFDEPRKLRSDLANAGWPDGLDLNMAYVYTPGVSEIVHQFQAAGIRVQPVLMKQSDVQAAFDQGRIQVALLPWLTLDDRTKWVSTFGDDQVIDLYSIPISYQAVSGLKITFTPDGWPLASR